MFDPFIKMRDPFLRKLGGDVLYTSELGTKTVRGLIDDQTTVNQFDPNVRAGGQVLISAVITMQVSAVDVPMPNTDPIDFDTVYDPVSGRSYKVVNRNEGDTPDASGTWTLELENLA